MGQERNVLRLLREHASNKQQGQITSSFSLTLVGHVPFQKRFWKSEAFTHCVSPAGLSGIKQGLHEERLPLCFVFTRCVPVFLLRIWENLDFISPLNLGI